MGKEIVVVGSSNTDMTIKGDKLPVPGETVAGGVFYAGQGGKGANQAVAARRLGGEVAFVCKVGNDIFAENSLKSYVDEGIDISGVLRSKEASGVGDVVVTLGSKGSLVCAGSTFETVEAQKVKAVDATAAGDTFCGGLAVGLSEGLSLVDAARFATRASAITVQRPGAQNSIPYRKEL